MPAAAAETAIGRQARRSMPLDVVTLTMDNAAGRDNGGNGGDGNSDQGGQRMAGGEERARPNAVIMTVGIYWDAIVTLI